MISNSQLQEIAKRAGIIPQTLIDAISATDEKTIELNGDGAFFTIEESQALESKGKKTGYEEGKTAGYEILTKEIKKLAEVDFEGKTAQNVVSSLKEKFSTEAGKEPSKVIEDLTKDKQKLQTLLSEKETELTTVKETYEGKLNHLTIESQVKTKLPDKLENGLTRDDLFVLLQSGVKINRTENGIELIDPKTNEVMKDKKQNPIKVEDYIPTVLQKFGVKQEGRADGDGKPKSTNDITGFKKRSEVFDYFEKNETPINDQAGILLSASKNEGFNMNE